MADRPVRAVAVDWSGAKSGGGAKGIALAVADSGRLVELTPGLTREDAIERLKAEASDPSHRERLVVGLDFAFSAPEWFVRREGCRTGPEFWERAAAKGEQWLAQRPYPFWSPSKGDRARRRTRAEHAVLRATDEDLPVLEISRKKPESVFRVSGQGSVGSSSLRGIPHLAELRKHGFAIWPWDRARPPVAMEIWPRLAIGTAAKTNPAARVAEIEAFKPALARHEALLAAASEDLFDAAFSALWLERSMSEATPRERAASSDPRVLAEGRIWLPKRSRPIIGGPDAPDRAGAGTVGR